MHFVGSISGKTEASSSRGLAQGAQAKPSGHYPHSLTLLDPIPRAHSLCMESRTSINKPKLTSYELGNSPENGDLTLCFY